MSRSLLEVGVELAQLGADIAEGRITDAVTVAKRLLGLATDVIPVDALKDFLTDRDRRFADLAADVAEDIKTGGD
jgi:hypothetical protein